jgi:hypothetical protein
MNPPFKYFLLLGMALMLAACGPIYKTQYIYIPPESPEGRQCLAQCELVRYQWN